MNEKAYISGPMTGLPDYNRPAFREAAARLRSEGYEVFSPVEMDEHGDEAEVWEWEDFLCRDLQFILQTDIGVVFLLNGWEHSRGAQLEALASHLKNIRLVDYETRRPISVSLEWFHPDPA